MKQFKYRVEDLIRGVKEHPVLWDKTSEFHMNRDERKEAWDEIIRSLEEGYDDMTREEKRNTNEMVTSKWTNVRDAFLKTLRNRSTKIGTRKYHYHDEMSFLLKVMPPELATAYADNVSDCDADGSMTSNGYVKNLKQETSLASDEEASTSFQWEVKETKRSKKIDRASRTHSETPDSNTQTRRKRSRLVETEHKPDEFPVDFVEVNEVNDPRVMNEDEAFFASLLPTVVKYSEDERLEFRIEVLAVMKNISSKRRQI